MAALTRQDIRNRVALLNGEMAGTADANQPFLYDMWIDAATDEISALVGGYYTSDTADIVSGTALYCSPQCYQIVNCSYVDASGALVELTPMTPTQLDTIDSAWRNDATGLPISFATRGLNSILLYPKPNFSRTAGLVVEGYFTPGSGGTGGASVWPNPTDACPLPIRSHIAVLWRTAYYRAVELGKLDKAVLFDKEYKTARGMLERQAATHTAAISHRDALDVTPVSPAFNPLDL